MIGLPFLNKETLINRGTFYNTWQCYRVRRTRVESWKVIPWENPQYSDTRTHDTTLLCCYWKNKLNLYFLAQNKRPGIKTSSIKIKQRYDILRHTSLHFFNLKERERKRGREWKIEREKEKQTRMNIVYRNLARKRGYMR